MKITDDMVERGARALARAAAKNIGDDGLDLIVAVEQGWPAWTEESRAVLEAGFEGELAVQGLREFPPVMPLATDAETYTCDKCGREDVPETECNWGDDVVWCNDCCYDNPDQMATDKPTTPVCQTDS